MKIIITEDQARRLNILNSDSNPIEKLEQHVKLKADVVDSLYQNFVNLSIIDALSPDFDTNILNILNDMGTEVKHLSNLAYRYLDNFSDEEAAGLDVKIDEATSFLSDKISGLELIINNIRELQNITNVFKTQKPIDITDKQ
jgi:hypothetical protein